MLRKMCALLLSLSFVLVSCNAQPLQEDTNPVNNSIPLDSTPLPSATATDIPKVSITHGDEFLVEGNYDAAYIEFQHASLHSSNPEEITAALLGMGKALYYKGDSYGAINQFSTLLINYPDGDSRNAAFFFLAKAYDALAQYRLAAEAYGSYLQALPGPLDSEILEMQANSLEKYGDHASAIAVYEKALASASVDRIENIRLAMAAVEKNAGNTDAAITTYLSLLESTQNKFVRSEANLLLGRIYLDLGMPEQAYARFTDSVNQAIGSYDTYSALAQLINDGQPVDQLNRGEIDYYAGQYGVAIEALTNYLDANLNHTAKAHALKAKSYYALGQYENEISEWDKIIRDHSNEDESLYEAYKEKSGTQWTALNDYLGASQTCLDFVAAVPSSPYAGAMLDRAARILVDGEYLSNGAEVYEQLFTQYPVSDKAYPGLFSAGILYYRLGQYEKAQVTFQRLIVLTEDAVEQAAEYFWVAKSLEKQGKTEEAILEYQKAVNADPTGYYSIRADQILKGETPFTSRQNVNLAVDLQTERIKANRWVIDTFKLESSIDLDSPGELANNIHWLRAEEFNKLGMRTDAAYEFDLLRNSLLGDAVNTYRLLNRVVELGYYRTAIFASRHVLDMAGLSQAETLTKPPIYFNHIRFGVFYRDTIVSIAREQYVDPLFVFSIIRQESMFDNSIRSTASARGLMQITPATATTIVEYYGWPTNFIQSDLDRPYVNIRMGVYYFRRCLNGYDNIPYAALAAYNAGNTAANRWQALSGGDVDLFLELINYQETKDYIRSIVENFAIYEMLYSYE